MHVPTFSASASPLLLVPPDQSRKSEDFHTLPDCTHYIYKYSYWVLTLLSYDGKTTSFVDLSQFPEVVAVGFAADRAACVYLACCGAHQQLLTFVSATGRDLGTEARK